MSFMGWIAVSILGVIGVYVAARLATHAYFKSRSDYERKQQ